jgi:two-component system sensor histidine kinase BaeS
MTSSIKLRLFLWLLAQAVVVIGLFTILVRWSFDHGFIEYIASTNEQRTSELARQLEGIYRESGSWAEIEHDRKRWVDLVMDVSGHGVDSSVAEKLYDAFPASSFPPDLPAPLPLRFALLDANKNNLLGPAPGADGRKLYPIGDPQAPVGYVGVNASPSYRNIYDVAFDEQFSTGVLVAAAGSIVLALVLSLALARFFLRPINSIGRATRELASGNYAVRMPASSTDELGQLSRDINELAASLGRHAELEKQWLADISHELRTPVSLLLARIEALQDGVRHLDSETINSLHRDVMRLSVLIGDLYQLSLSDLGALRYERGPVDLREVTRDAMEALEVEFESRGITLQGPPDIEDPLLVHGDSNRLEQMLVNLLANSAAYTDPGGKIRVSLSAHAGRAWLSIDDTPPSVPATDLPFLFDRLFRSDSSRSRRTGGGGLGLAIAKAIVDAHQGEITACQSELGGLRIDISLPLPSEAR